LPRRFLFFNTAPIDHAGRNREQGGGETTIELVTGAVALAILVYMVVWMYRHTMGTMATLRDRIEKASQTGSRYVAAFLAFVVVFREGVEAVLFFAARSTETPWPVLGFSGLLGFAASAFLVMGIFRVAVHIHMQRFFALTGALLILLSAGVLVGTVGAAEEVGAGHGWPGSGNAWDLRGGFAVEDGCRVDADPCPAAEEVHGNAAAAMLHTLVGYDDHPSWAQVVAYLLFVGGFGGWTLSKLRRKTAPASRP
ncbi:MAG: FTR1 family protein, partial [Thermoplasmatota archaeon]